MREQLHALYELQRIDSQALECDRSAESIPKKISELENGLEGHRTELGELNSEADTFRAEQQEIESHISEERAKHQKWKRRLNEIKTPREYQALSREIELGERRVHESEERVLEIMGELESRQKVIDKKQGMLREKEANVGEKTRDLRSAHAKIADEANAIRTGRVELLKSVPANLLKRYEMTRDRRNGLAVALVQDGTCSGCNVKLRPQVLVEILKYRSIETCQMCTRILVHEELVKSDEEKSD